MRSVRSGKAKWILFVAACLALASVSPQDARAVGGGGGGGQQTVTITGADICGNTTTYPPAADYDKDGLTNGQECDGLNEPQVAGGPYLTITGYRNKGTSQRTQYLDPSKIDLFVWLDPASPTDIPTDNVSVYTTGLGATVHFIGPGDVGSSTPDTLTTSLYRAVTAQQGQFGYIALQKAVRIVEDPDEIMTDSSGNPLELGVSSWGTPNGPGDMRIFAKRIKQTVANKCQGYATCKDNAGTTGLSAVQNLYIRHTIGHELGHSSKLTTTTDANGYHHYPAESYTVMEASVAAKQTSSRNGGTMTFWISTGFAASDRTDAATGGY